MKINADNTCMYVNNYVCKIIKKKMDTADCQKCGHWWASNGIQFDGKRTFGFYEKYQQKDE